MLIFLKKQQKYDKKPLFDNSYLIFNSFVTEVPVI